MPEDRFQLRLDWVTTRDQLNEVEQANITEADLWAFRRRRDVLNETFLLQLHRRMFGKVWRWAGRYRDTELNLGVAAYRIPVEMRQHLDTARFWLAQSTFTPDEIAVRFHHRQVLIHPFTNGNGRHARLAADLLVVGTGGARFTWGRSSLVDPGRTRAGYIDALRAADRHEIAPLLAFARS